VFQLVEPYGTKIISYNCVQHTIKMHVEPANEVLPCILILINLTLQLHASAILTGKRAVWVP